MHGFVCIFFEKEGTYIKVSPIKFNFIIRPGDGGYLEHTRVLLYINSFKNREVFKSPSVTKLILFIIPNYYIHIYAPVFLRGRHNKNLDYFLFI